MPDLLTLTCPSCGAKLRVTENVSLLACANCGNEHMVHRDGGAIYLAPMAQDVRHIRTGVDKTAAELAVARLTKDVEEAAKRYRETENEDYVALMPVPLLETAIPYTIAVLAAIMLALIDATNYSLLVLLVIIVIGLAYWKFVLRSRRIAEAAEHKEADLAPLQQLYNEKKAALDRNQKILDS